MRLLTKAALSIMMWLGLSMSTVQAAVILTIDNKLAAPGETVLVGVYAASNIGDVISGFNLPLDFNVDGFVDVANDGISDLPPSFTLNAFPLRNIVYNNTGLDRPLPQIQLIGADTIPTGSGGNIVLGPNPTKLFDVAIDVSATAVPGDSMPINIILPAAPLASLFNVAGPNSPTVTLFAPGVIAAGSITVVGVPEPTSLGAVALGVCALQCWRRRRRK